MSAFDPMADARKIVDDHRKGRMLVSCEVAYRVALELVHLRTTTAAPSPIREAPRDLAVPLRVRGVGRVADEPRALLLVLNERPTDDEIRALHDHLSEVVIA